MQRSSISLILLIFLLSANSAAAQRTEVMISLGEQFFDTLLDATFRNAGPPEFSIVALSDSVLIAPDARQTKVSDSPVRGKMLWSGRACKETVRVLRENNGIRTSVRFRDGKIFAPLAFSGGYRPPFVGCVEFSGWAETNINLEFDQQNQRLVARASVLDVSLNGTGGVGGTVIAKLIQAAIDKKVNPIELMKLDKISFTVPIQNSQTMRMRAVGVRNEIVHGALNVYIAYEFIKS